MPSFPRYTAWAKKVAARPRPKPGAGGKKGGGKKGGKAGSGVGDEAALIAQIRARQAGALQPMGGVLGKLMARYGGATKSEGVGELAWCAGSVPEVGSCRRMLAMMGVLVTWPCLLQAARRMCLGSRLKRSSKLRQRGSRPARPAAAPRRRAAAASRRQRQRQAAAASDQRSEGYNVCAESQAVGRQPKLLFPHDSMHSFGPHWTDSFAWFTLVHTKEYRKCMTIVIRCRSSAVDKGATASHLPRLPPATAASSQGAPAASA